MGTTPVPSSMPGTSRPTIASTVSAVEAEDLRDPVAAEPLVGGFSGRADRRVDAGRLAAEDPNAHGPQARRATGSSPEVRGDLASGSRANLSAHADVAQLVERNLAKVEVAGSNPVVRSKHHRGPALFVLVPATVRPTR